MFKLHSTQFITKFILKLHTIHYTVPIILVNNYFDRYLSLDLDMHFIKYLYFVGTKSSYWGIIPILSATTLKMGLKF